jgi:hypothetical protein
VRDGKHLDACQPHASRDQKALDRTQHAMLDISRGGWVAEPARVPRLLVPHKRRPAFVRFLDRRDGGCGIHHAYLGRVDGVPLAADVDRHGEDSAFAAEADIRPLPACDSVSADLDPERCHPPGLDGVRAGETSEAL